MKDLLIVTFIVVFIIIVISSAIAFLGDIIKFRTRKEKAVIISSSEKGEDEHGDTRESS